MSIIKRLGNLAKGTIAAAGGDGTSELEKRAREQALKEELARLTPSPEAHAELERRKAGGGHSAPSSRVAPGSAAATGLDGELARLDAAFADGVLTRAEYDRKRAESVARSQAETADDADDTPEIKRTL